MFSILYSGYEFFSGFLPFFVMLCILWRRSGKRNPVAFFLWPILFSLYVHCVFHVTGAGTLYEALDWKFRYLAERVNLIPFSRDIDAFGYAMNVVMFLPFGFLVPLLWKKATRPGVLALSGMGFSLLIELSQLLSIRGTDVDDLIMNTLGACLGYLVYRIWARCSNELFQQNRPMFELPLFVLLIYLGRCFLYNALGFIELWYGY